MNKQQILESLNDIFINVLDNDKIAITESTTSDDINDWDSLNHIHLVIEIEKFFIRMVPTGKSNTSELET